MGEVVCYKRASTVDQNLDRQLPDLQCDREFVEKVSGKDMTASFQINATPLTLRKAQRSFWGSFRARLK